MDKVGGEEEEGPMYGESNIEIYNTMCKIDSQQEFALWLRELKLGFHDNLEGWEQVGDGREVPERGDSCVPMTDARWCMAETNAIL